MTTKVSNRLLLGAIVISILLMFGLGLNLAERNCRKRVAGEINSSILVSVKALILLRDGKEVQALTALETSLDLMVVSVGTRKPWNPEVANALELVRNYRRQYGQWAATLKTNRQDVLLDRFDNATKTLSDQGAP